MDKQFTASEVRRLSNRIPRSNDEIADAQEALRAFADLLEAREKAREKARAADAERLAEALRMCMDIMLEHGVPIHPYADARVAYTAAEQALAAHSAQAQPPVQSEYAPTYPDQAKDPFWTVPGMVDTRPKTHGTQARPAARVTDAMVDAALTRAVIASKESGIKGPTRYMMRAALAAALAAQENTNGV